MSTQEQWRIDYEAVRAERAADNPPHPDNFSSTAAFDTASAAFHARQQDRRARSAAATAAGRAALNEQRGVSGAGASAARGAPPSPPRKMAGGETLYPSLPKYGHIRGNPNFSIFVQHIPTQENVRFDGWVSNFQDQFVSSWKSTPVYGRMDDLHTFQRTGRKISLAFDVLAADATEAARNQTALNVLTQFLYPVYTDAKTKDKTSLMKNQRVLVAPPLLKLRWSNMVENTDLGGLVGFLNGFAYTPEISSGQFFADFPGANLEKGNRILNYQHYTVQLEFTVIHTHLTGWSRDSKGNYIFGGDEEQEDQLKQFPRRTGAPANLSTRGEFSGVHWRTQEGPPDSETTAEDDIPPLEQAAQQEEIWSSSEL
jgi:hypothetical protein